MYRPIIIVVASPVRRVKPVRCTVSSLKLKRLKADILNQLTQSQSLSVPKSCAQGAALEQNVFSSVFSILYRRYKIK
jgi:hypothetical protein